MLAEKPTLGWDEIEAQVPLELPARDMLLITVIITNVLNNNTITVDVRNVNVAVQLCAQLIATGNFDCDIQQ
ncbi:MAG: hypothetical protein ABR583_14805 [Gaiellaceae bacterium]